MLVMIGSTIENEQDSYDAAQAQQRADAVKGDDGRLISHVLARLYAGLVAVGGNLGV
jgi:hypothetical protein